MARTRLAETDEIEEAYLEMLDEDTLYAHNSNEDVARREEHIRAHLGTFNARREDASYRRAVNVATIETYECIKADILPEIRAQPPVRKCELHLLGWKLGDKTAVTTPRFFMKTLMYAGGITTVVSEDVLNLTGSEFSLIIVQALMRRWKKLQCTLLTVVFQSKQKLRTLAEQERDADGEQGVLQDMSCMFVNGYFEMGDVAYEVEGRAVKIE